jgi:GNAT superfamily N-acetyltransferase
VSDSRPVDLNDPQIPTIRVGHAADAESISMLILELAERFVLPEFSTEGRERFATAHTPAAIEQRMQSGYRYHVAERDGELVGVVGICEPSHLYHLFVAARLQGHGLGRRLWEVARVGWPASNSPRTWTVRSSRYAVPVYERFGFVATGPPQVQGGVLIVPMELREPGDSESRPANEDRT